MMPRSGRMLAPAAWREDVTACRPVIVQSLLATPLGNLVAAFSPSAGLIRRPFARLGRRNQRQAGIVSPSGALAHDGRQQARGDTITIKENGNGITR
jgi:hypothetical protein